MQNLYLLQIDLRRCLDGDLSDPAQRREAQARVKEFSTLLKQADWRYMGGEDVLMSLQDMEKEFREKIVARASARKAMPRVATRRAVQAVVKKATTRPSAKVRTAKPVQAKKVTKKPARKSPARKTKRR